jgi:chromosome partitioning protein
LLYQSQHRYIRLLWGGCTVIICVTNQKGGCGKTTLAINLAAGLAVDQKRVLLIDLDPQAPIAPCLSVRVPEDIPPLATALIRNDLSPLIQRVPSEATADRLWIVPGDVSLDHQALSNEMLRDTILKRALARICAQYDHVILDTPPSLDLVTINAIMAADFLILPCDADRESFSSLARTLEVAYHCAQYRQEVDPQRFAHMVYSLYDEQRDQVINAWLEAQVAKMPTPPFETKIRRSTAFKKARANGQSIFDYAAVHQSARRCAEEFSFLAEEVIGYAERADTSRG